MSNQKILCIIPARGGSKSIKRKNIRLVNGKPLIFYAIKAALDSGVIDRLVVSTEDDEIAEVSREWGAEVIKRPDELASDTVLTEPVMLHALEEVEKEGYHPDYISLIQCTSPLLTPDVIKQVVEKLINNTDAYDSCATFYRPHFAFQWKKTDDSNEYFISEYPIEKKPRRQDLKLEYAYRGAGACYITKADLFKKTKNRYGGNDARVGGIEIPEEDSLQIDSEYDLLLAEMLIKKRLNEK